MDQARNSSSSATSPLMTSFLTSSGIPARSALAASTAAATGAPSSASYLNNEGSGLPSAEKPRYGRSMLAISSRLISHAGAGTSRRLLHHECESWFAMPAIRGWSGLGMMSRNETVASVRGVAGSSSRTNPDWRGTAMVSESESER